MLIPAFIQGVSMCCAHVSCVTLCERYRNGGSLSAWIPGNTTSSSYSAKTEVVDYKPVVKFLAAILKEEENK
jgi:hypothetical protein